MENLFAKLGKIDEILRQGSTMCPKQQFPKLSFICGFMSSRFSSLSDLFSLLEVLHFMLAQNKINKAFYEHILSIVYDRPHLYDQITTLLDKVVQNSEIQIKVQLDKIQRRDQASNKRDRGQVNNGEAQQTKTLKKKQSSLNGTIQMPDNTIQMDNDSNVTQKYDDDFFEKVEMMNKQSEALARKLQEEEEQMARAGRKEDEQILCDVCFVGLYDEEFVPLESCEHIFHKNCLFECFKSQISENKFPLTCPNDECRKELKDTDIKRVLNEQMRTKYQKNTLKFYADMNGDTISWCPTADCEYMFFFEKEDDVRFGCAECKKDYCLNCRVDWHKDMTCKEYQITNTHSSADDAFMKFVKGKKFKQCPKCKFWVEKNQGCDHMTCKCKFQFCYKCGGVYGKCECIRIAQENNERRREQQRAKQEKKKARAAKLKQPVQKVAKTTRSRKK